MVMTYVTLIANTGKTKYTIDNVPSNLKAQVLETLLLMGLDGYGKPITE